MRTAVLSQGDQSLEDQARTRAESVARNSSSSQSTGHVRGLQGIERLPLGACRALPEFHSGLFGRPVGLAALQVTHAATQLVQLDWPPCERGLTWSIVNSSTPGWAPQYWQV